MAVKFKQMKRFSALLLLSTTLLQAGCVTQNKKNSNSNDSLSEISTKIMTDSDKKNTDSVPRNIIVFIGDGMGISTITAGRIFVGQDIGKTGEEHELSWDKFEQLALVKTYNSNAQVPDSAGTATAILSGYKTNIGAVNVRPDQNILNMIAEGCGGTTSPTLTDKAKADGKSVGVVTTARLTHATPAAMYAHSASRRIETDDKLVAPFDMPGCKSISQQLIESDVDLAFGGGLANFTSRQLQAWPGVVATNSTDMMNAPSNERLLAVFEGNEKAVQAKEEYDRHMNFESKRPKAVEPSIKEMTTVAMERLSSNRNGYVLMVESGRIDHAHHGTNAYNALNEVKAFDEAVAAAVKAADDDTLILVTADHSHVFTMAGYPTRGNPILGLVRENDGETGLPAKNYGLDSDKKPYTTLGYHNGPNVREANSPTLTQDQVLDPAYQQQTAVRKRSETHGGEDVALFATGPGSDRFNGVMEQDEIGRIIADLLAE